MRPDEVVAERSLLRHDRLMITGVLLAESLRVGASLAVPGLRLRCVHREDVSGGTTSEQPDLWTFIEFEAPSKASDALSRELSSALLPTGGWYADFSVDDDHVVVYAGRAFRYHKGDVDGRAAAQEHGRSVGVPVHQLDWQD
jgi:hypothetical protein